MTALILECGRDDDCVLSSLFLLWFASAAVFGLCSGVAAFIGEVVLVESVKDSGHDECVVVSTHSDGVPGQSRFNQLPIPPQLPVVVPEVDAISDSFSPSSHSLLLAAQSSPSDDEWEMDSPGGRRSRFVRPRLNQRRWRQWHIVMTALWSSVSGVPAGSRADRHHWSHLIYVLHSCLQYGRLLDGSLQTSCN